jgi:uncharacterized protein YegJ (DUF2314 family)
MWPFLDQPTVHPGVVLYRGPIAPPMEQVLGLASPTVTAARVDPPADVPAHWAVRLTHATWGDAVVLAPREPSVPDEEAIRWGTFNLVDSERELAGRAETALIVHATSPERGVLGARKHLLRWLHLLMALDGLIAIDATSQLFWSAAMLDDELSHDADLDVEALFTIHAVFQEIGDEHDVYWLHTHGLDELGAFDIDVLRPSPEIVGQAGDPLRALAFAALEGVIAPSTRGFALGAPGGTVDLVPVSDFDAQAADADAQLRDAKDSHGGRRAVVCEPRGLFGFLRRRPIPSRFLSTGSGNLVFNYTDQATDLMAGRARATLDVFKALAAEFTPGGCIAAAKIGYPTTSDPDRREHLWFQVHGFDGNRIDGTLMNRPFDVALDEGARDWHALDGLSDWIVASPAGSMTPRNLSAARKLRASGWPGGPFAEMIDRSAA